MAYSPYSIMDICSYCEVATESMQKSIEIGNFDGANIQLCSYLIEIYTRYQSIRDTEKEKIKHEDCM